MQRKFEAIAAVYNIHDGIITSPGKFEGEHWSTVALHELSLDGCADCFPSGDGSCDVLFLLADWSDIELNAYGLTVGTFAILLHERSDGFVSARTLTQSQLVECEKQWESEASNEEFA